MRKLTIAAMLFGLGLTPALAQQQMMPGAENKPAGEELSRADCQRNFRTADLDGDNILSLDEQESSTIGIPTGLALSGPLTQQEFMTLCTANIPKGG